MGKESQFPLGAVNYRYFSEILLYQKYSSSQERWKKPAVNIKHIYSAVSRTELRDIYSTTVFRDVTLITSPTDRNSRGEKPKEGQFLREGTAEVT